MEPIRPAAQQPSPSSRAGLEHLRRARRLHDGAWRAAQVAAPVGLVVVVAASLEVDPRPGLSGQQLVVLVALVVFVVASALALYSAEAPRRRVVATASALVGSATLTLAQPAGIGVLGVGVTGCALLGLVSRRLGRIAVPCAVVLVVVVSLQRPPVFSRTVLSIVAVGVVVALVTLAQRMRSAVDQAEELLVATERARRAEQQTAVLQERQQLAREMHDVLAHSLSGLTLQLEGARLLARDRATDPEVVAVIERAQSLARSGLDEARQAIGMLRDDDLPGSDRLDELVRTFVTDSGVAGELRVDGARRPLPADAELALYRVTQEALTNVVKHSGADRVDVTLRYGAGAVFLRVADHGTGRPAPSDIAASGGGHGLNGMRERAELLGGALRAGPTPDGFEVELELPG